MNILPKLIPNFLLFIDVESDGFVSNKLNDKGRLLQFACELYYGDILI